MHRPINAPVNVSTHRWPRSEELNLTLHNHQAWRRKIVE
ncbi:unnamed protein product [Tenebrio molitor]|nr:unnamed protein product [Tenebrio molitor]